jgi:hypothetical protein
VIDPGFYDWSDTSGYGDEQAGTTGQYAPYADYGMPSQEPYPAQQPNGQLPYPYAPAPGPSARPAYGPPASTAPADEPVTLVFSNGRSPQTVRNYMMNTTTLTDLDPEHYERIPLNDIDIVATVRANRSHGVDFQVPNGTR